MRLVLVLSKSVLLLILLLATVNGRAQTLPAGFVYLRDIDPTIQQDIRYAGYHNFIGRPIKGYGAARCVLSKPAAVALAKVQQELKRSSLSLKVFDCYRPQRAVDDFIAWSKQPSQQQMKAEFYPRVNKRDFFALGYVAAKSGHSRGSTVDLTIVSLPLLAMSHYKSGQQLVTCYAPYLQRFRDGGIDMGTGFDCMDTLAHALDPHTSIVAQQNRILLRRVMQKYGFEPYAEEWWHFTLANEPYPNKYFNFPLR